MAGARSGPSWLHCHRCGPSWQYGRRTLSRRRFPVLVGKGARSDGAARSHRRERRVRRACRHEQGLCRGYSLGGCAAAALLGAVTATSRFQSSPSNKDFGRGPREFPDLADHLPGLIESSAIFRESWARMSNDFRDARFKTAFLMAPGRSVLGFSEKSLASIETPTRIVVGGSDFVQPAAIWLHGRLRTGKLDSLASEAGHYVFLPEATDAGRRADPTCWIDAPGVDRRSVHKHVAALAAELFLPG
jgi:predicted dienelactone hydrolase